MSENSAVCVLEDGSIEGGIRASALRPLLTALLAARDGEFVRAAMPARDDGIVAELTTVYNHIVDRSTHFNDEVRRV